MIIKAIKKYKINGNSSIMIGEKEKDILAANEIGI